MFDTCIKTILTDLNRHIKARTGLNEDQALYATYTDLASPAINNLYTNKVIMSVVDIVHQETTQSSNTYIQQGNNYIVKNLPINFYLYILFAAHFEAEHALEGLSYLARVIAFFNSKNYFTSKNTPDLTYPELDGISVSIINLDHEQKSSLWTCLKSTYMPSVVYKIGMIPIEDNAIWPTVPPINEIYNSLKQ
ncbi:MAG: hypothetical protein BGO68_02995 [Candidatus Amoebophilus sp. 36-38]|mgnify:CR=1 FL=1|nr:MAG: hypothetical protein BGO68_02995 [Candidatus Amoebophilus sp. 36-38]